MMQNHEQNHVENPRQKPIVPAKPASLKAKQKLKEHLQNDEVRTKKRVEHVCCRVDEDCLTVCVCVYSHELVIVLRA